jgi:hypothetical protein
MTSDAVLGRMLYPTAAAVATAEKETGHRTLHENVDANERAMAGTVSPFAAMLSQEAHHHRDAPGAISTDGLVSTPRAVRPAAAIAALGMTPAPAAGATANAATVTGAANGTANGTDATRAMPAANASAGGGVSSVMLRDPVSLNQASPPTPAKPIPAATAIAAAVTAAEASRTSCLPNFKGKKTGPSSRKKNKDALADAMRSGARFEHLEGLKQLLLDGYFAAAANKDGRPESIATPPLRPEGAGGVTRAASPSMSRLASPVAAGRSRGLSPTPLPVDSQALPGGAAANGNSGRDRGGSSSIGSVVLAAYNNEPVPACAGDGTAPTHIPFAAFKTALRDPRNALWLAAFLPTIVTFAAHRAHVRGRPLPVPPLRWLESIEPLPHSALLCDADALLLRRLEVRGGARNDRATQRELQAATKAAALEARREARKAKEEDAEKKRTAAARFGRAIR